MRSRASVPVRSRTGDGPRASHPAWAWLFCLPFALFGLFSLFGIAPQIARSEGWVPGGVIAAGLGLVFCAIGFGLPVLQVRGRRAAATAVARYPDAPWMRREEWASGQLQDSTRARLAIAWLFALVFGAFSVPLLCALPRETAEQPAAWAGLIFPVAAIGMWVWALRETQRYRRFGRSTLDLATLPGVVGGALRATLQTGSNEPPERGFELRLRCIRRRRTGAGKNRSTHEKVLWESEQRVPLERTQVGPRGIAAPVEFTIPYSCPSSDPEVSDDYVLWRLDVRGDHPGVDFWTCFDVPIFRTPESSEDVEETLDRPVAVLERAPGEASLEGTRIRIRPWPGGKEFDYPAGRPLVPALLAIVVGGLFGAVVLLPIPIAVGLFFGLIGGAVALCGLVILLQQSRVRVDAEGVEVTRTMLGLSRTHRMARTELEKVEIAVGMRSGERAYYDVRVIGRGAGRRTLRAGTRIPSKRAALAIAQMMKDALGIA